MTEAEALCHSFIDKTSGPSGQRELYRDHVISAIKTWEELRPFYEQTLSRVLGISRDSVNNILRTAIILHDIGKLTRSYVGRARIFRHEIFSAYAVTRVLEGLEPDTRAVAAGAVLMHHEPIAMRSYVGELGERYLSLATLKRVVDKWLIDPVCDVGKTFNDVLSVVGLGQGYVDAVRGFIDYWLSSLASRETVKRFKGDMYKRLRDTVLDLSVGELDRLLILRNRLASLLHVIVVTDDIAAVLTGRGGEEVWVTKMIRIGAEPINIEDLKKKISLGPQR